MAAGDTFGAQPAPLKRAVYLYGLDGIMGTGGRMAAVTAQKGREGHLIYFYDTDQYPLKKLTNGAKHCIKPKRFV